MGRDVPFDQDAKCDDCGLLGAFDFMGDLICQRCLDKASAEAWTDICDNKRDPLR